MNKDEFLLYCTELGISLSDVQLEKLEKYYNLLIKWNDMINLTAIVQKKEVYLKHFYDSLTICKAINLKDINSLCDVGTGAGFPGLVLKIVFPHLSVTLVDSLNKRVNFLKTVVSELALDGVYIECVRAEEYALVNREKFDLVVARAVAKMPILLEICIPMVKVNNYFIAYKGLKEEYNLSSICDKLSIKLLRDDVFNLPFDGGVRSLIVFKKNSITSLKYPRRFDKIKKSHFELVK